MVFAGEGSLTPKGDTAGGVSPSAAFDANCVGARNSNGEAFDAADVGGASFKLADEVLAKENGDDGVPSVGVNPPGAGCIVLVVESRVPLFSAALKPANAVGTDGIDGILTGAGAALEVDAVTLSKFFFASRRKPLYFSSSSEISAKGSFSIVLLTAARKDTFKPRSAA